MKSNRKKGVEFEIEFSEFLSSKGFWSHNVVSSTGGQPADIIAAINGHAYLIDCKDCEHQFDISRIEENQINAMNLWNECNNGQGLFAIRFCNTIVMIKIDDLLYLSKIHKKRKLSCDLISTKGLEVNSWLETII